MTAITLRAMKANLTATLVLMVACEVAACGSGPNKDAMTMEQCRERLAMPKDRRPRSDDPRIDKDAICENMLSSEPPAKQVAPGPASKP